MIVYWSACLISILFTWLATHIKHNKDDVWYWLFVTFFASFPLIIISAIRYNVGADYLSYYKYYIGILNGADRGRFEILYYLINKLVAFFKLSPPWIFGLSAALFLMPIYKRIILDSANRYMSIFLLFGMTFYFYFLNASRQMIGASFLIASIPFIEKREFFPFLLLVMIATGFHTICIVFLPVYFFVNLNLTPKTLILITLIVFLFGQFFANIANSIIGELNYYSIYLNSSYAQKGQGYVVLMINILIIIFCTFFYQHDNLKFKIYYNLQTIALWASALTGRIVLIDRFRMIFGLASIILIPMTLNGIKNKNTRIIFSFLIVSLFFIYASYSIGVLNSNQVLPYQIINFN